MTMVRPPPDSRTTTPISLLSFLLHAENDALSTDTVGSIGFNEFLQYAPFHKLLLSIHYFFLIFSISSFSLLSRSKCSNTSE